MDKENNLEEFLNDEFWHNEAQKRGERMANYNRSLDKIAKVKSLDRRLELYRLTEEGLLNDGIRHKIPKDFKEDKLAMVRSAIKRTEKKLDGNKKEENNTSKTDSIFKIIHQIALRRSNTKKGVEYQKIVEALTMYHEKYPQVKQKDIAEDIGVTPQSLSEWKKEFEEKIE